MYGDLENAQHAKQSIVSKSRVLGEPGIAGPSTCSTAVDNPSWMHVWIWLVLSSIKFVNDSHIWCICIGRSNCIASTPAKTKIIYFSERVGA